MRIRAAIFMFAVSVWLAPASTTWAAGVDVIDWSLTTLVRLDGVGEDGDFSGTPVNPFEATHSAAFSNSTAQSIYNVSWDTAGNFDFLIEAEHNEQGNSLGFSRSTGSIALTVPEDSLLTMDAEYNYSLGNGDRDVALQISAGGGPPPPSLVFFSRQFAMPIGGDPPVGTFTVNDSVPLIGGELYVLGYDFEIRSFGGSPTSISTADGHLSFHIEPAPEPSSALLVLLVGALLVARRVPWARKAEVV